LNSRMHSRVSSDWLPSNTEAMKMVFEIFKMDRYFLDSPCMFWTQQWIRQKKQCSDKWPCLNFKSMKKNTWQWQAIKQKMNNNLPYLTASALNEHQFSYIIYLNF
jgi:hypothetical protein